MRPLALILLLAIGFAAGTSASRAAEPEAGLEGDSRLRRRVSLEVRHAPVDEVVQQVAQQSGVSLQVSGDAADLRITGLVSEVPLGGFMAQLGTLLNLTWRRAGNVEAEYSYTLLATDADRARLAAEQRANWMRLKQRMQRLIRALGGAGDPVAERFAALPAIRGSVQMLAALPPTWFDELLKAGRLQIRAADMTPAQQQALRTLQESRRSALLSLPPSDAEMPNTPAHTNPAPPAHVGVELEIDRRFGDGDRARVLLRVIDASGRGGGVGLQDVPRPIPDALSEARHFGSRRIALQPSRPLQLPSGAVRWEETLLLFARENRINVLSDAFDPDHARTPSPSPPQAESADPPDRRLDQLCYPYDYTWNAAGPLVLFRQRDWYFERERQIPERLAREWRKSARQRGSYSLDELAGMAELPGAQRLKLRAYAGTEAASTVLRFRNLLVLWARLSAEQKAMAQSAGLPVERVGMGLHPLLLSLAQRVRPESREFARSLSRIRVQGRVSPPTTSVLFSFRDGVTKQVDLSRGANPAEDPLGSAGTAVVAPTGPTLQ
ncbi:MAG: hypothetical protein ACK47B_09935 [Armatimonadota bacterium]